MTYTLYKQFHDNKYSINVFMKNKEKLKTEGNIGISEVKTLKQTGNI
jgi:hypothetical protein